MKDISKQAWHITVAAPTTWDMIATLMRHTKHRGLIADARLAKCLTMASIA